MRESNHYSSYQTITNEFFLCCHPISVDCYYVATNKIGRCTAIVGTQKILLVTEHNVRNASHLRKKIEVPLPVEAEVLRAILLSKPETIFRILLLIFN